MKCDIADCQSEPVFHDIGTRVAAGGLREVDVRAARTHVHYGVPFNRACWWRRGDMPARTAFVSILN